MNLSKIVFINTIFCDCVFSIKLFPKSELITTQVRGPTCVSVCVLSILVLKISILKPSDEPFGKSAIALWTTFCQSSQGPWDAAILLTVFHSVPQCYNTNKARGLESAVLTCPRCQSLPSSFTNGPQGTTLVSSTKRADCIHTDKTLGRSFIKRQVEWGQVV